MRDTNQVLSGYGTTIFEVMSRLAVEEGAVNLGQGFPDGQGPDDVRERAKSAISSISNQYPPMRGLVSLRTAVAEHGKRFYGLEIDPAKEVLVTSGATEALAVSLLGLLNPGDEVLVLDPAYDSYRPIIELAGAVPVGISLLPPNWRLDKSTLQSAITAKTKLIVFNSPMNPTGRVFSADELSMLAEVLIEANMYAICDEVYEHLVFDGKTHTPLMSLPGMKERTLRIGSAGKTFSLTGWKVGYITGNASLIDAASRAHQFVTFTTPPNLQEAVAFGLSKPDEYFSSLAGDLQKRRDLLRDALVSLGMEIAVCEGTYFLCANYAPLGVDEIDIEFCKKLTKEAKVATIPCSVFYPGEAPQTWLRFALCKEERTLLAAIKRLKTYFGR